MASPTNIPTHDIFSDLLSKDGFLPMCQYDPLNRGIVVATLIITQIFGVMLFNVSMLCWEMF
jgi:hypothetical protein